MDVIPVDLVVAALIAVAAAGPDPCGPDRVPGRVRRAESASLRTARRSRRELVHRATPLRRRGPAHRRSEMVVPGPRARPGTTAPGDARCSARPSSSSTSLPLRGERAEGAARIEERRSQAERALSYVELYGAYSETEARFRMDRTVELFESLDPADQAAFCFDPARDRLAPLHRGRPSALCRRTRQGAYSPTGRRTMASREERSLKAILSEQPRCAAFDLENTLIASNVVESYAWLATRHLERAERARLVAGLLAEGPEALAGSTAATASDFLRAFYRRYEGAPARPAPLRQLRAVQRPARAPGLPRGHRPGATPPRPRPPARFSSPARSTSSSSRSGRCSTRSSARTWASATASSRASSPTRRRRARPAPCCSTSSPAPRA